MLNVVIGFAVNVFGSYATTALAVLFHVLGVVTVIAVFRVAYYICESRATAFTVSVLLCFSPAFVLYENWLMYTLPTAALLVCSAYCLSRFAASGVPRYAHAFFWLLALTCLTRGLFHIGWFLVIVAGLYWLHRDQRKTVLLCAALPLFVVAGWYGKNAWLFGQFSASGLLGLGLSNITTLTATKEELQPLVQNRTVSEFALLSRYSDTEALFNAKPLPPSGKPILDNVYKSTGEFNYNNQQLAEVEPLLRADALAVAKAYPANYVIGVLIANRLFFSPSSMNEYFSENNKQAAAKVTPFFNRIFYATGDDIRYLVQPHFGFGGQPSLEVNTSLMLIVVWFVVLGYLYLRIRRSLRCSDGDHGPAQVLAFMFVNLIYVYGISTTLELAENYRYKFLVEPFFMICVAALVVDCWRRWGPSRNRD